MRNFHVFNLGHDLDSKNSYKFLKKTFPFVGLFVGLFLIIYPFVPNIKYLLLGRGGKSIDIPYVSILSEKTDLSEGFVEVGEPIPLDNTLVIPKIGVDVKIVNGDTEDSLLLGAWHRPGSGDPVRGGNYVVTGHRFRYVPPNNTTFYNLDKLEIGDFIIIYYEGIEYDYEVEDVFIVNPEELHIEADLGYDALTLYTCTPLWTSSKRLVIRALPI